MAPERTKAMDPAAWPLTPAADTPPDGFPSNIPFVAGVDVRLLQQPNRTVAVWAPGERERTEVAEPISADTPASPGVNAAMQALARAFNLGDIPATSEERTSLWALLRRVTDSLDRDGWADTGSAETSQPFSGIVRKFSRGNQRLVLFGSAVKDNASVTAVATDDSE